MIRRETVFGCGDALTPDVAAKLTQLADGCRSKLQLECGGKRVPMDSLIGVLALDCRRGTPLAVIADGVDEAEAAEAVVVLLEG